MRVGFLDTWLPRRYQPFWVPFVEELGARALFPKEPFEKALEYPAPEVGPLGRAVLSRVAELKELGADRIVIPDAQLGVEAERGSGACLWVRDLEAFVLYYLKGLPPLFKVPAELGEGTAALAAELGARLGATPPEVQLALERTRPRIAPPGPFRPEWARPEAPVGLAAPPYLLEEERVYMPLVEALAETGLTLASRAPAELREEGERLGLRLKLPTDLEWAGAAHHLAIRHDVEVVLLFYEAECPGSARVARWLGERLPKPVVVATTADDPEEVARRIKMSLGGD